MSSSSETHAGNGLATDETQPTSGAENVRAEHVEISQGGAGTIEAATVSLQQGGAGRVNAHELTVAQGGVGLARVDNLRLESDAGAFAIVSDEAHLASDANVFVLIARNVTGDVRPILDWRAVAALGAALVGAVALLRRR